MSEQEKFSVRRGLQPPDAEITVRHDAPSELRGVLVDIAYESGLGPSVLRGIVCRVLRVREDPGNWSEFPNIDSEVRSDLDRCQWYEVYDVAEAIYSHLLSSRYAEDEAASRFADELNKYFRKRGIGWQLRDGELQVRGPEPFENVVVSATERLKSTDRETARTELHQALLDLSKRPDADLTGALQHALAALECVARDVCGDPRPTLGQLLSKRKDLIPAPLDQAVEKAWGYASEVGRHLREGREPDPAEAELVVGIAASVISYLLQKASSNADGSV